MQEPEAARARPDFVELYGAALRASGVPERYWERLLHKLEHEVHAGKMRAGPQVWRCSGHSAQGALLAESRWSLEWLAPLGASCAFL